MDISLYPGFFHFLYFSLSKDFLKKKKFNIKNIEIVL